MIKDNLPKYSLFHTLVFDFDGVFTNNKVIVSEAGEESVICNRADGLGLDLLRAFKKKHNWELDFFVISTEKNLVVKKRSEKLNLPCFNGVTNKLDFLKDYLKRNKKEDLDGIIFLGNDLNDLSIMRYVGYSIAPNDAHPRIKSEANLVLPVNGGDGFVRYFIEKLLRIDDDNFVLEKLLN